MLNLSKEQSLNLLNTRKQEVNLVSTSKLPNHKARVAVVLDFSGSMRNLYREGHIQATLERILPIALQFDDNGELDVWLFDDRFRRMPSITEDNFYGYVQREIIDQRYRMGGTNYAPVISDIGKKYLDEEPSKTPNYVLFITDGNNSDKRRTTAVITELSRYPIFFQFVGIGNQEFTYLEKLDDLNTRYVDNADFFVISNPKDFYEKDGLYPFLLNEYPNWLEYPRVKEMLQ